MANDDAKVRRTLHLKFKLPSADPAQLLTMIKAAAPFYEMFGNMQVRLLQNVDDPGTFIQVMEYETPETIEVNRQRIAGDPRMQGYLQTWRALLPGALEVDVYTEVSDGGERRNGDPKPRPPKG